MFDNIGWGEILVLIVLAVIIIGPERLPEVLKDIRAAVYAARRGIANARAELDGMGAEFDSLREPISQAAEWGRLGPKRAIAKALFEGDESTLDDFDPKQILAASGVDPTKESPAQAARRLRRQADAIEKAGEKAEEPPAPKPSKGSQPRKPPVRQAPPKPTGDYGAGTGFSWADIT
ncbi:Sec-independent protein translocase family protein [Corynebacterium uterequi]|uniref:Sec-independent protein translocase protein TatB n=1 Tax=Corynebacterium uterequi TaxID=1072256 RepID=A0A0G3HI75_9CORY|nr:preprotein translocase [Corynebacterium uterequi]AKK10837.1 hypothetical protein CUTER_04155 [Corynebacterium uterequi]